MKTYIHHTFCIEKGKEPKAYLELLKWEKEQMKTICPYCGKEMQFIPFDDSSGYMKCTCGCMSNINFKSRFMNKDIPTWGLGFDKD